LKAALTASFSWSSRDGFRAAPEYVRGLHKLSHPQMDCERLFWALPAVWIDFFCYHLRCHEKELHKRITFSPISCQPHHDCHHMHLCAPLLGHSYVFHNKANLSACHETRLEALFLDSGMMVQLEGDYALVISRVSELLLYTVLAGWRCCLSDQPPVS